MLIFDKLIGGIATGRGAIRMDNLQAVIDGFSAKFNARRSDIDSLILVDRPVRISLFNKDNEPQIDWQLLRKMQSENSDKNWTEVKLLDGQKKEIQLSETQQKEINSDKATIETLVSMGTDMISIGRTVYLATDLAKFDSAVTKIKVEALRERYEQFTQSIALAVTLNKAVKLEDSNYVKRAVNPNTAVSKETRATELENAKMRDMLNSFGARSKEDQKEGIKLAKKEAGKDASKLGYGDLMFAAEQSLRERDLETELENI